MATRAGVIPYIIEDDQIKMLFMKPSDPRFGGPDFQVAKGVVEDDEPIEVAAMREAYEELGLLEENVSHYEKLGCFLHGIHVYLARINDITNFVEPHYETGETCWLTIHEFGIKGRDLHHEIVVEAHDRVAFINGLDY